MGPKLLDYSAVLGGLKLLAEREGIPSLYLTAGDQALPGPFYQAAAEGWPTLTGLMATSIGDHEFDGGIDGGIDGFVRRLRFAEYPFLGVNLDFSNVQLSEGVPAIEIGEDAANVEVNKGKVAKSAWIETGGERIGLIGRAPDDLFDVTFDPETNLPGLDFIGGRHPEANRSLKSVIPQISGASRYFEGARYQ